MSKSVYSLALSDDIIHEIDRLAYQSGTNRSVFINNILAEYLEFTTPEQRMREIFDRMESLLFGTNAPQTPFQMLGLPSDTMLSLRSAIHYKYNPTAKYSVELYRQPEHGVIGELRVSIRTQNRQLIEAMQNFYRLWNGVERAKRGESPESLVDEQGRFSRKLQLKLPEHMNENISGLTVGDVLSEYITAFDQAMKLYFQYLRDFPVPDLSTEESVNVLSESPAFQSLVSKINSIYDEYSEGEVTL